MFKVLLKIFHTAARGSVLSKFVKTTIYYLYVNFLKMNSEFPLRQ